MKKSLLFATAALLLSSSLYAKKWDFTNWSSETVANIVADEKWTGDEKGNGTVFEGAYWYAADLATGCSEDSSLMANGVVIKELVGLKLNVMASKNVAIATDYQITKDANAWGPYQGPQYLWFAGAFEIRIPGVKPGTNISAGVESHKPSDGRGIDMYVNGEKVAWTSGQSGYPTTYDVYTWQVPENIDADVVDVIFKRSNGCHVYYFDVEGYGDDDFDASAVKVAYLYDGTYNGAKDADKNPVGWLANGGLDGDLIYAALTSYDVQTIDYSTVGLTSAELNDSLLNYDVVVLSEAVSSSNTLAKGIYDIVNKVPMLNLKSFFYKSGVWGVGAGNNPSPKATTITVAEDYLDDALFANVVMDEGVISLYDADPDAVNGNLVQGCTPAADGLFGTDEAIATVPSGEDASFTAIHTHGTRNMYMLIPLSSDNSNMLNDNAMTIISNAVEILAKTKSSVQKAGKPNVEQQMANNETTVSISSSATNPTIYYSIDGGDYAIYSEPFVVTKDGTVVKAYAIAHGYDTSDTTEVTISVQAQASAPRFASVDSEGFTTITLTAAEGTSIYFNFVGGENAATSQLYTEPIVLKEPATLTAFATGDGVLQSESVSRDYSVGGIPAVKDTIAHFTANEEAWFTNVKIYDYAMVEQELPTSNWAAKAAYYWGKSGWSYYSTTEVDHTEIVYDEDGVTPLKSQVEGQTDQDSVKTVYKVDPTTVKYVYSTVDTQWRLRSQGQAFTGETNVSAATGVGNAATGYYAETAFDEIGSPSKGKMTFGGKASGEAYSASVESTVKFEGEFDVVTYLTNGGTSAIVLELQTSTDGETWATVDTLSSASTQRYFKKDRFHISATEPVYIRIAQTGGGSKGQLYDIYVISTEGTTGIDAITANDEKSAKSQYTIDLMGRRAGTMVPGQMYLKDGKTVIVR
ncbi:MAG: chitobiase/beta-hexosaminidase C-terminal domain-containing protein [Bacteroidales bacterium]|nr:chitobiase/beta-hexosaminidase C-terminal domain-containing protein [Bacteroidales bacterium]